MCTAHCELPRCSPFLRTSLLSLPRLLARPTRTFCLRRIKEKTGAAQEEEKEKREWKWEKVTLWRERERILYEYTKTPASVPSSPPPFRLSSYIPEISASFHTDVITALSSSFSFSPFRVGFPFFPSFLLLSPAVVLVSRIYFGFVCFLYTRRGWAPLILCWNAAIWKVCFRVRSRSISAHGRRKTSFPKFLAIF